MNDQETKKELSPFMKRSEEVSYELYELSVNKEGKSVILIAQDEDAISVMTSGKGEDFIMGILQLFRQDKDFIALADIAAKIYKMENNSLKNNKKK